MDGGHGIELHVEPRVSKPWEAFVREAPPCSIALDGYAVGVPAFDPRGPHANFDHHAGVNRIATRSTCMQVFMAISLGLFDVFRRDGEPFAHVWVNDCDQDTCLAVWLLRNPGAVVNLRIERPLASLLVSEDILDATAGAYPASPAAPGMRRLGWVFAPYDRARQAGRLATMDADGMRAVLDEVGSRISLHAEDRGAELDLDTAYDEIGGGPGWRMIVERSPHARTALFHAGVRAYVASRENGDGSWTYSIGKMSPFVRFPLEALYRVLNAEEGREDGPDGWGGSDTIGGSPRRGGSRLPPAEVERAVNAHLAEATPDPDRPRG